MDLTEPLAEGRIAEVYPWGEGRVLKLARGWVPADWVEYEFKIAKIVHASGLGVPEPYELITHEGRPGIVYSRVDGPTMLARIARAPHKANAFARRLAALHAAMHSKPGAAELPDNHAKLRRTIESVEGAPPDAQAHALRVLDSLPQGGQLLHGDYHPDNVILTPTDAVIIDWTTAARGHPLGDVARTRVLLNVGSPPNQPLLALLISILRKSFERNYLRAYFARSPYRRADLEAWLYPVLFARLGEGIEAERAATIRWLERLKGRG